MGKATSRIILIAGDGNGIGEAAARLAAESGATVLPGARRTERFDRIVADIAAAGGIAEALALDVAHRFAEGGRMGQDDRWQHPRRSATCRT